MLLPAFRTTSAVRAATHIVGRWLGVWLAVLWLAMPVLGLPCCTDCCTREPNQAGHCCNQTAAPHRDPTCCGGNPSDRDSAPCPCRGTSGCTCGVLKAPAPAVLAEAHSGQMQQPGPEQLAATGLVLPGSASLLVPAETSTPSPAHSAGLHVILCRYLC